MTDIFPEVKAAIILTSNEIINGCWKAIYMENQAGKPPNQQNQFPVRKGCVVLTNNKLIFVALRGVFTKEYYSYDTTNYEEIVGIMFSPGIFSKSGVLAITKKHGGTTQEHILFKIQKDNGQIMEKDELIKFKEKLERLTQDRLAEIEKEKKKSTVQYVIDFSFLKAEMEKGGITLTTVKCPSCGGNVDLPESGNTFLCNFCNSTVHAHDIFDKMKSFLGNL